MTWLVHRRRAYLSNGVKHHDAHGAISNKLEEENKKPYWKKITD
ncbi:hypothetical protein CRE_12705 [Caenorhabditis remanei]|uniref:Uncharacterized protein n=1 Tax=Caenorhabditis remanei TaxID=31234 RepID=E3M7C6_CAERE|nr:hypothetical protein CRE_12705 [Caenorhabditis remanei]